MGILDRSESRRGAQVIWLAVHDTEGGGTARQLRDADWWEGSSHAIADNLPESQGGGLLTPAEGCVPYDRASWTLRGGNRYSENLELVGMASWSRAKWLTQTVLLDRCARWLADRHKARPWIPLVKIGPADVAAGRPGVIGHADYTYGTGDGTHWDPGPNFPWDVVLAKAAAYREGDDMFDETRDRKALDETRYIVGQLKGSLEYVVGQQAALAGAVAALAKGADVDEKALAAALAPSVISALGQARGITAADVEAAVRKVLADAATA